MSSALCQLARPTKRRVHNTGGISAPPGNKGSSSTRRRRSRRRRRRRRRSHSPGVSFSLAPAPSLEIQTETTGGEEQPRGFFYRRHSELSFSSTSSGWTPTPCSKKKKPTTACQMSTFQGPCIPHRSGCSLPERFPSLITASIRAEQLNLRAGGVRRASVSPPRKANHPLANVLHAWANENTSNLRRVGATHTTAFTLSCGISDLPSGVTSVPSTGFLGFFFYPLLLPFFTAAFLCGSEVTSIHFSAQTLNLEPAVQQSSDYLVFPEAKRTLDHHFPLQRHLTAHSSTATHNDLLHIDKR